MLNTSSSTPLSGSRGRLSSPRDAASWIFDLDNTLYPATDDLFVQVSRKIRDYIAAFLEVDVDTAYGIQKDYFHRYGTSLRGLMLCHSMDPGPFLDFVHDVDLSGIDANPALDAALAKLPGRKVIFTNASSDHAERILGRLGIAGHFEAIFDIVDADYIPKPEPGPYDILIERLGLDPQASVMIDDIARNLIPAAERGLTTVWLHNDTDWGRTGADSEHIHYVARDLPRWLESQLAAADPDAARRAGC